MYMNPTDPIVDGVIFLLKLCLFCLIAKVWWEET